MSYCSTCGIELSPKVHFCSACGQPVQSQRATSGTPPPNTDDVATIDYEATATSPLPPRPPSGSSPRPSSRTSTSPEYLLTEGRFLPGRLIAGRYRIIALLGKGGMGEVYRADDLTLGQAVAMKFLPEEATRNEGMAERFRNEVRIARRVSHPNVCRVYDVGEVDGQTFFTMEYVDGEDLASLLRRIGRLPQDKAVEMARQLCAGLAAAHNKGVLHRDLKPANIMLDGRGQVVITDFGLAGVADNIRGPEVRSGTPAYMAPEQLAGTEVTMLSDIYALGLVLYEIFTGKRAFAEKAAGVLHANGDRTPSRPSSVVKDLDPIIEKVILRCLEAEPASRPANALAVSAALPGGDPLAAALAAGETPSPQMVAAAGETVGLRPRIAIACFVAVLIGLAIGSLFIIRYSGVEKMRLEQTPEVLSQKAREIVTRLGYPEKPADRAFGFDYDTDYVDSVEKEKTKNWDEVLVGRPSILEFWYRQSPDVLAARGYQDLLIPGIVQEEDPALTLSGMVNVKLDALGRLIYFQAVAPQKDATPAPASPADWSALFSAADLDISKLQPALPQWTSAGAADTRAAWTGVWPGSARPLRVEAAAWHGKPVFFAMIGDWNKPWRMLPPDTSNRRKNKISQIIGVSVLIAILVAGVLLARRNYRHGRGDREGAFRLAAVMFVLEIALWLSRSHFSPGLELFGLMTLAIASALLVAGIIWTLYMAVEPWIRRRWPQALISWTRLISGQFRDPVVGRDILFGVAFGVAWLLMFEIPGLFRARLGTSPPLASTAYLVGGRYALSQWLMQIPVSIISTLQFFLMLFGVRWLVRKDWIAATLFVAYFVVTRTLQSSNLAIDIPVSFFVFLLLALIVYRFGLVPLAVGAFTVDMLANVPLTADFSAWYMTTSLLALLSVVALAVWGFYHALGTEKVWKVEME
ncbi:MAG TPA: serine/threonine-protein kinase [Candidatus Dormibacteraeota bacterium]|nr:serine/threonine-protein kinase [Candidatus Dormibacteraeota bacterium]